VHKAGWTAVTDGELYLEVSARRAAVPGKIKARLSGARLMLAGLRRAPESLDRLDNDSTRGGA